MDFRFLRKCNFPKTLLLLQVTVKNYLTSLELSSQWSSQVVSCRVMSCRGQGHFAFKVILGSFGAISIIMKMQFSKNTTSTSPSENLSNFSWIIFSMVLTSRVVSCCAVSCHAVCRVVMSSHLTGRHAVYFSQNRLQLQEHYSHIMRLQFRNSGLLEQHI